MSGIITGAHPSGLDGFQDHNGHVRVLGRLLPTPRTEKKMRMFAEIYPLIPRSQWKPIDDEGILRRWVIATYGGAPPSRRISLTAPVINAAAEIAFIVSGAAKAGVLRRVLAPPMPGAELPAQLIKPLHGVLNWYVDAAASTGEPA